jgi:hypothetical protein
LIGLCKSQISQLQRIQANPTKAVLSEKNGKLRLVFEKIYGIDKAREVLGEVKNRTQITQIGRMNTDLISEHLHNPHNPRSIT